MLNDGNLHMKLVLLLLVTMFYHLLVFTDMSTLHSHGCFLFFVRFALSIQLKRFLFLFHIYVKIHFVFYFCAMLECRCVYILHPLEIGIIFERHRAYKHQRQQQQQQQRQPKEKKKYIIERACKSMWKIPRHITSAKTRQENEMLWITMDAMKWVWVWEWDGQWKR